MNTRDVARKLRAWQAGVPLARFETLHHAVVSPPQAMIAAFVRMAGESRPWGIAWGTAGTDPKIASVPDGRVRDDVAVLCADFAEDLLAHMRVHNWTYDPVGQTASVDELRQLWLPNGQHLAMLHQLNYTYSQTKFGGANQDILQALGRLAGWMFRDCSRTGHQHVVDASDALVHAYAFPAQDARTAHLGYQLAWLTASGDRDERMAAAAAAERLTVSPTMDPSLERDELSDLVEKWQAGRREGTPPAEIEAEIADTLSTELDRRWRLTEQAYLLLVNGPLPVNPGVDALVAQAHSEFWFQHQRIELRQSDPSQGPAFIAHPETDFHGSSAASRYLTHASFDEGHDGHLVHHDAELLRDALAEGRALRASVTAVANHGSGRSTIPVWTIRVDTDSPHRLRENGRLVPYGSRGHEATVTSIMIDEDGIELDLEWTTRKTMNLACGIAAKPVDPAWIGESVQFVIADAADLTRRRSQRVWAAKDGPGAWLTHGKAPVPVQITDDDGASDLLVDDVTQIAGATS
jgi:hypothetical protein